MIGGNTVDMTTANASYTGVTAVQNGTLYTIGANIANSSALNIGQTSTANVALDGTDLYGEPGQCGWRRRDS